jgi:hypothetical protein
MRRGTLGVGTRSGQHEQQLAAAVGGLDAKHARVVARADLCSRAVVGRRGRAIVFVGTGEEEHRRGVIDRVFSNLGGRHLGHRLLAHRLEIACGRRSASDQARAATVILWAA